MLVKQLLELFEILDSPTASGASVKEYLIAQGSNPDLISVETCSEDGVSSTDFIKIVVPGEQGKHRGGHAPTLGVVGRLGGLGARPERIGFVSDGDGALASLAVASKLIDMQKKGDVIPGDVIISTHICPDAPTQPHEPVSFMGSPVSTATMNLMEVDEDMDAVLSIDTTKGNRIINTLGVAISPTVKEGYILKVSNDLLDILALTSGDLPFVFALSDQDITPYGNDLYHINSILQPATATNAPVVGVAITTKTAVPGSGTGATTLSSVELAARFCLEVAKEFTKGVCSFYSEKEFSILLKRYGSRKIMQTQGQEI